MNMAAFAIQNARPTVVPDHEVVIIGAGISGIGAAIQLLADGIKDILILERSEDVGGTWRDNRYPGIAVDITSFTYSFSFEQNANWSRVFAPGNELYQYTRQVTSKYGIYPLIRFGVEVTRARFDLASHVWLIELGDGRYRPKCRTLKGLNSSRATLFTLPGGRTIWTSVTNELL